MSDSVFELPADFEAACLDDAWRDKVGWPVHYHTSRIKMFGLVEDINGFIAEIDNDEARDIVVLASTTLFPRLAWLVHTALAVAAEQEAGAKLIGAFGELDVLRGQPTRLQTGQFGGKIDFTVPSLAWLRRLKICKSWNSMSELAGAVFLPQATVLSTNDLLVNTAVSSPQRIDFQFAEKTLIDARRKATAGASGTDLSELANSLASRIANSALPDGNVRIRLKELLVDAMMGVLKTASRDLNALMQYKSVPREIWSGTGAKYLVRALGLEVLRRGGKVVRFGHGGSAGMTDYDGLFALSDLAATSHYVAESKNLATFLRTSNAASFVEKYHQVQIVAPTKPSGFEYLTSLKPKFRADTPKVVYVGTATRGRYLQGAPPQLPDVVYVDWQIRFAEMLRALPIDLLCKPHPHGLFANRRHPVEEAATATYRRFEDVMAEADVFVFDAIQSTAFWEALCTDKPVIAVGFGQSKFAPKIAGLMAERCRILPVEYDEWNRPQVDREELFETILGKPYAYDPKPMIELMTDK